MSKFLRNINISEVLIIVFILLSILLAINLFPYPYFLIGDALGNSAYDGEPDYYANILSIINHGVSYDFLHPGIPLHYLVAILSELFLSEFSPENILSLGRSIILIVNLALIYIGSRVLMHQDISYFLLLLIIFFLFPAGFVLLDNLSPNSILFGLSIVIFALGFRLYEKPVFYSLLYGLFLGFAISIKFISILLFLPVLISLIFSIDHSISIKFRLFIILKIFASLIFSIAFFSWQILPFLPYIFTHHNIPFDLLSELINTVIHSRLFIVLILLVSLLILILFYKLRIFLKWNYLKTYNITIKLFIFNIFIITVIKSFSPFSYIGLGYELRNLLPLIGAFVIFFAGHFALSIQNHRKSLLMALACLILLKSIFNLNMMERAKILENEFIYLTENINKTDYLVFYPPYSFSSKKLFMAWSDYRYGDSSSSFVDEKNHFEEKKQSLNSSASESFNNFKILNIRKFNLSEPTEKISYKYFDAVSRSNFFSKSQRAIAKNQMNLLTPKDICTNLFDGFDVSKSFEIIIPESLVSYYPNFIGLNGGLDNAISLRNILSKRCKLHLDLSTYEQYTQKFYVLTKL